MKKHINVGILAHVDAGKTTLSEAMLYVSGTRRTLGRVDHADAFLDTDAQERARGITIFSKQAIIQTQRLEMTLLDTPGHVDFSTEMERTLQVLDYAILVISGTDGVQGHTRTLWQLLRRYEVPTFIFINKSDLAGFDRQRVMAELTRYMGSACVDFTLPQPARDEAVAMCDEEALDAFLDTGAVSQDTTARLIARRRVYPCYFGAALKLDGVDTFLEALETYTIQPKYPASFGARVFKITYEPKSGTRLTWLKVTGGLLRAKAVIAGGEGENQWEEKADQLRVYSGLKYQPIDEAAAGQIVAVTGLTRTYSGEGIGREPSLEGAMLTPVISYQLILPEGVDPFTMLPKLRTLEQEDPQLRVIWNEQWKQIHMSLMGQVQQEVLTKLILDRLGIQVRFGSGHVIYKETIADTVEGIGHFEPLRHYAEVHLLLEPGPRGSGVRVASRCPTDVLDAHWQQLILTHVLEREHPGILTGSALTDVKISLLIGKAHLKHTEGGDFRQATYRAIRQGLMQARPVLMEPFYDFTLELPPECLGRAMNDIQNMGGTLSDPVQEPDFTRLSGFAPVAVLQDYWNEVTAYTRGRGRLSCALHGYEPCGDPEKIMAEIGYSALRDVENPADSVFCDHGGGFNVRWDLVREYMDVDSGWRPEGEEPEAEPTRFPQTGSKPYTGTLEQDRELLRIFERTYGKMDDSQRLFRPAARHDPDDAYTVRMRGITPQYLIVDGYNLIFAWEELKKLSQLDIASARSALIEILSNYRGFHECRVILVFDGYKVKGSRGSTEEHDGIHVIYTREGQTADNYIEQTTYNLARGNRVRVVTSDHLEQMITHGHDAGFISSATFRREVEQTNSRISELVAGYNMKNRSVGRVSDIATVKTVKKKP